MRQCNFRVMGELRAGGLLAALITTAADADPLPLSVQIALRQAQLPPTALGVVVQALDEPRPCLAWQADAPQNPASLIKLVTSMRPWTPWAPPGNGRPRSG